MDRVSYKLANMSKTTDSQLARAKIVNCDNRLPFEEITKKKDEEISAKCKEIVELNAKIESTKRESSSKLENELKSLQSRHEQELMLKKREIEGITRQHGSEIEALKKQHAFQVDTLMKQRKSETEVSSNLPEINFDGLSRPAFETFSRKSAPQMKLSP